MSTAKKILKNTLFGALSRIWLIIVGLILTPLILSYLGNERFALWAIFWSITAYVMLMDLGLGVSLVRCVAQASEKGDWHVINQAVVNVLVVMLGVGSIMWLLVLASRVWLLPLWNVSPNLISDVEAILQWSPVVFLLIALFRVFDSVLRGLQRFDVILSVSLAASLMNVLSVYVALSWGYGVEGLMLATVLTYSFQLFVFYFLTKRSLPTLVLKWSCFDRVLLKSMLPLGARIQVAKIAELASYQTDKLLLAVFTPLSMVTFYDLGSKIAAMMRDGVYTFTTAIFPVASQIQASGDHDKLWFLYERGSKYLLMFSLPALAVLLLTAPMMIGAWLGHVSPLVYQATMVLGVAYWVIVSMAMAFNVGTALNWSKSIMRGAVLQTLLNISLSALLISQIGFMGALWGTLIAVLVSKAYVMRCFYRDFERNAWKDMRIFFHVLLSNMPAVLVSLPWVIWLTKHFDLYQRTEAVTAWFLAIGIYMVMYVLSIRILGLLDQKDLDMLGRFIPLLHVLVKHK